MKNDSFENKALVGLNPWYEPQWSKICGIVRGYDQISKFRYACTKCEIMIEMTDDEIDVILKERNLPNDSVDDPITAKGYISRSELIIREKFLELARNSNCNHFEQRLNFKKEKE